MFNLLMRSQKSGLTKEEAAELLKINPELLESFEKAYQDAKEKEDSDNLFDINAKQAANIRKESCSEEGPNLETLKTRIINELLALYRGELPDKESLVTVEELAGIPEEERPFLAGTIIKKDIKGCSYPILLMNYKNYLESKGNKKMQWYNLFRQGLDLLDLDPVTYEIIGMNRNSMGYWFPKLSEAAEKQDFFKIPKTKIIKVPLPILQLTRNDYFSLTKSTIDIVNRFCQEVFELDPEKTYFIKTGTYSSKYDFRNAKVTGAKEVMEIGEYLLFIHFQALEMASPLSKPCIYGACTTNEWVVREFIEDKENNPCIYKGLPLHTEYRVFVDFDTDEVLGISPYWRSDVMKRRFGSMEDKDKPDMIHDYVIYSSHEEVLMKRYDENREKVLKHMKELIPDVRLEGQWSIDVMQNGDDFWIIDMADASTSALRDCVPKDLLRKNEENWLPDF